MARASKSSSATATSNEAEAWTQLAATGPDRSKRRRSLTVAEAFDAFLDWASREKKPATFEHYRYFLQSFADTGVKSKPVCRPDPAPPHEWLQANTWNSTSRNRAVSCVKRRFNWCVQEGLIPDSPLKAVKKDRMPRREKTVTPEERAKIDAEVSDQAFRLYLFAMGQTGARSMEVRLGDRR